MKNAKGWWIWGLVLSSLPAAAQDFEDPRFQLVFSGGGAAFRGGRPDTLVGSAVAFQPNVTDPTFAGAFGLRVARHLGLELEWALSRGREREGFESPHNTFFSGGFILPWSIADGRLVPYAALGGGVVRRRAQDDLERVVETAFGRREFDPQGFAGGGVEWRLTRLFGVRADYRYFRIFPEDPEGLGADRKPYGQHRITGGLTLSY